MDRKCPRRPKALSTLTPHPRLLVVWLRLLQLSVLLPLLVLLWQRNPNPTNLQLLQVQVLVRATLPSKPTRMIQALSSKTPNSTNLSMEWLILQQILSTRSAEIHKVIAFLKEIRLY